MSNKALDFLLTLTTDKSMVMTTPDFWSKPKTTMSFHTGGGSDKNFKQGPYNFETASVWRRFESDEKYHVDFIPEIFKNKKFSLGDFEVTVTFKEWDKVPDDAGKFSSWGTRRIYIGKTKQWNVSVNYYGAHVLLGRYNQTLNYVGEECLPKQTNWFNLFFTKENKYVLTDAEYSLDKQEYDWLPVFFESLDINELVLSPSTVDFQSWYSFDEGSGKLLRDYSSDELDIPWFVASETTDGVYAPKQPTIDRFLLSANNPYLKYSNILKELQIHTIKLTLESHFELTLLFDVKDINIKAPQKLIQRYGYQKLKIDDKVAQRIKANELAVEQKRKELELSRQFTLSKNGKVILDCKDKDDIINYLTHFSSNDFEKELIRNVKVIFDKYPKVDKYYIAYWGTYFKYESSGKKMEVNEDCRDHNAAIISKEDFKQIEDFYDNGFLPQYNDAILEHKYGWPDRGAIILGVKRKGKKLEVFTENIDVE